jgi:hypothetical protein
VLLKNNPNFDLESGKWLGRAITGTNGAEAQNFLRAKQNAPDSI